MITPVSVKRTNRPHSPHVPARLAIVQFGQKTILHLTTADGLALEIKTILSPAALATIPVDTTILPSIWEGPGEGTS